MSVRLTALRALMRVIDRGQSLSAVRPWLQQTLPDARDRAFVMELTQGVLRWRRKLDAMLNACMDKPLRNKEVELRLLLLMALYELSEMQSPDYAVVDETVKAVRKLRKHWAASLTNAVLRRFIREAGAIQQALAEEQQASHPAWLLARLQHDWPQHWRQITEANNTRAALCLRVNRLQTTPEAYLQKLQQQGLQASPHPLSRDAISLAEQTDVTALPGYQQGEFAVQDAGAQLAAELLDAKPGQRVLDMCAAPGGKTCHMQERAGNRLDLLALDNDAERLQRVEENLARLQLSAHTQVADATETDWHDSVLQDGLFDCILLDAPCSATGVIRRHPDIKSLRREQDIADLANVQQQILQSAWRLLAPGGRLLYATCSVLRAENSDIVKAFLTQQNDAEEQPIDADWGLACEHGRQLLPGGDDSDGFYYALLQKHPVVAG